MKHSFEQDVHVRLDSPLDKRKAILQAAVDSIQLFKRQEALKAIRAEKAREYINFKKALVDIQNLVKEVRFKELPLGEKGLRNSSGQEKIMTPVTKKLGKAVKQKAHRVVDERSPLDRQLDELQRKLRSL
ncbi:hypothetical protein HZA98_02685 [Candidatus Woesearchaeota archaeon]|nr:hypothetical protein [Candidatus Woesearchaeota archaeon]